MFLRNIYDEELAQAAYIIGCQQTGEALVIDPERDIDRYRRIAAENSLEIVAVAETHIHADFVSGAGEFARDPRVTIYLSGHGGEDWSYRWPDGSTRVQYLTDGDTFMIGKVEIQAIHTPGHTPEHLSFRITDLGGGADEPLAVVTGDFLFVGDVGRPDLLESAAGVAGAMEPSARTLQESLAQRVAPLADFIQVLPGHGAGSACGKALGAIPSSTIGYERRFNSALRLAEADAESFVREILSGQPEPPLYFKRMKQVNRDGIPVTGGPGVPERLPVEDFLARAAEKGAVVLDGRADRHAFIAEHLPGSICAPLDGSSFSNAAGSFLSAEEAILLILEREDQLDGAVRRLYRIGFDRVVGWIPFSELRDTGVPMRRLETVPFGAFDPAALPAETVVLDVRGASEYDEGHVPEAKQIAYTRLAEHLGELPRSRRYCLYCASGRRATLAASFLASRGYEVTLIDGSGDALFVRDVA
ncbi:MAG: MBL fold metallo-hydrolase [Spirochaetaceae bacterium]|nr:MAG: MBL fold metallo-hydrolase [Spirochaetaceae bacterium]